MFHLEYGLLGLAFATSIKDGTLLLIVTSYGYFSKEIRAALVPINYEAFNGWDQYLKVALPCTVMICAEWWAFQVIQILAGIIGVN